jgi:hypothetical protein
MFNSFLGMSSGGGSGGGGDTLPTAENGVTFDEEEAAADFANQLGLPPAASITQTQGEQGIPLPPAVGIPLSPAAPAVGGGMNPPHPHINKQGPQASGGVCQQPPPPSSEAHLGLFGEKKCLRTRISATTSQPFN